MHYDSFMLDLVGATLVILGIALVSRMLRQPHVVGYLAAGIVMGPHGLALLSDQPTVARLGDIGVLLLLFFVGMETSPRRLAASWRITIVGTGLQVLVTTAGVVALGRIMHWSLPRSVLIGFAISLSSTTLVLNYLGERGLLKKRIGRDTLGILLTQDLALVPMLIVLGVLADGRLHYETLSLQAIGGLGAVALFAWIASGRRVRLPLGARLRTDHELQVFAAFLLCLGLALLTEALRLSTGFGAFLAGMLVGEANETDWVQRRLEPFRVVFVALFFVSIGLLVRIDFIIAHWALVALLTLTIMVTNTLLNAAIFRALGDPWRYGLFAGACLAQIGEFSFVLADMGLRSALLTRFEYQLTVAVIALSLMLSPGWMATVDWLVRRAQPPARVDGVLTGE